MAFENLSRNINTPKASNREFGLVFSAFFALLGGYKAYIAKASFWIDIIKGPYDWFLPALLILLITFTRPALLTPFNWIWMRFGLILHRVMNPLIMGLLFYGIITPIGVVARLFGWDPLRLCKSSSASAWILRKEQTSNLKNQF